MLPMVDAVLRPVQSPEWNINALVRYQWAMANGKVAIQVDSDYRSEQLFALSGLNSVNQGGYTVTNASLSYATEDEKWLFSLFVDNIFDDAVFFFKLCKNPSVWRSVSPNTARGEKQDCRKTLVLQR